MLLLVLLLGTAGGVCGLTAPQCPFTDGMTPIHTDRPCLCGNTTCGPPYDPEVVLEYTVGVDYGPKSTFSRIHLPLSNSSHTVSHLDCEHLCNATARCNAYTFKPEGEDCGCTTVVFANGTRKCDRGAIERWTLNAT